MHIQIAFRVLGILMMMFSVTMLPPVIVSLLYDDGLEMVFIRALSITLAVGFFLWLAFNRYNADVRIKDGFLITVLFYVALGIFGALPFVDDQGLTLTIPDGMFESFSGLTTTGATVIIGLDQLPESLLFYRQQLRDKRDGYHCSRVAIPMLGVGGMQLYRAETPGPIKTQLTRS